MSLLIIAEHDNVKLAPSTLSVLTAALEIDSSVDILCAGFHCEPVVEELKKLEPLKSILHADFPCYEHALPESLAPLIQELGKNYTHILAGATTFGKNVLPRAAALLDVAQISDVCKIIGKNTYQRPIYAANALEIVKSEDAIQVLTIRTTTFSPFKMDPANKSRDDGGRGNMPQDDGSEESLQHHGSEESFQHHGMAKGGAADGVPVVKKIDVQINNTCSTFVNSEFQQKDRPSLTSASIVISGGRGLGDQKTFEILDKIAQRMGAALGASRAAVDAGLVPNELQVGQTGQIVAPQLYIAVGISGAIQHLAGMKDSKIILAINKDPDAPIFEIADFGLVSDLHEALKQWEIELEKIGL